MTKDDYFKVHIPHRINLLITYRERYSNLDKETRVKVGELTRDFLRCSKDISMLMVRFLLGEVGISLQKGHSDISESKWKSPFANRLPLRDVICDNNYQNILDVLKAANRAVAHLNENDVNHAIELDVDDEILFQAIDFTEKICIKNLFEFNAFNYHEIMSQDSNNMNRERLKLVSLIK